MLSIHANKESADSFIWILIQRLLPPHIQYTPGGVIYEPGGSNVQHVTSIPFMLLTYAKYQIPLKVRLVRTLFGCRQNKQETHENVLLGRCSQRIHHRGSSLPSIKRHLQCIACKVGMPCCDFFLPHVSKILKMKYC